MAEFPAMPLWTDAYLGDTTHLNCAQHGAYLLLLITAWRAKSHTLPNNDKMLASFTRQPLKNWKRMRPVIEPFFVVEGNFWISPRVLDEVQWVQKQRAQRIAAGKASALKRLNRDRTAVRSSFNGAATPTPTPFKKENFGFEESKKEATGKKERIWIARGTEQWKAWELHWRKTQGTSPPQTTSRNEEGWFFESEFPQ